MGIDFARPFHTVPKTIDSAFAFPDHIRVLRECVSNSPKGSEIYVCISHLTHDLETTPLLDSLIVAHFRGVNVRTIIRDDLAWKPAVEYLRDCSSGGIFIKTVAGCFGNSIHTKLFLFSDTSAFGVTLKNVLVIGSFTITEASLRKHQSGLLISDQTFYSAALQHWRRMLEKADVPMSKKPIKCDLRFYASEERARAYCSPFEDVEDPFIGAIERFRGDKLESGQRPVIRIAMARWTDSNRGNDIADILRKRVDDGCALVALIRTDEGTIPQPGEDSDKPDKPSGVNPDIVKKLKKIRKDFSARVQLCYGLVGDGLTDIHSKYMLYEGFYGKDAKASSKMVWIGSQNFTGEALKGNDEILVKLVDGTSYENSLQNFELLRSILPQVP